MRIKLVTVDVELSPNTKRAIRWLLMPLAVFLATSAVALAYDTTWIAPGAPVQSSRLKQNLDEIQTRLVALENARTSLEAARGSVDLLLVTSSVNTNHPSDLFEEVAVTCPSTNPIPVTGGCYSSANSVAPASTASVPFRTSAGAMGWKCRFEQAITENNYAFALCGRGAITPSSGAFPVAGF